MYLVFGQYTFPTGAVHIATRCRTDFGQTGRPISRTYTFSCRATLTATDQAAMKTAILELEAALTRRGQDLILYQDDGSNSAVLLKNNNSLTGVRVIEGPTYPSTEGAENALYRTAEVVFEAAYPWGVNPDGTGSAELSDLFAIQFEETVTISGGGAQYVHKPNRLGPFQKQMTYPIVPWVAVQAGSAVGMRGYPAIPPPIWPQALKETQPKVSRKGPRQDGLILRDYTINWEWTFESVTPLVGLPHYWTNP